MITAQELRQKYLDFFKSKGHKIIPSASLIPENDPTVLFIIAGMQPIIPYLLGQRHPEGKRLVDVQKCVRTIDLDNIGDTYHHTFFEMLGNWSLGDYFKEDAIKMSFEFLIYVLNIPIEKLAVTCFGGDERVGGLNQDIETSRIWLSLGIPESRIAFMKGGVLESEDNWWGPAGETGPCGPSTEMFYWKSSENTPQKFDPEDNNWVEIWNDVLMEYNKDRQGKYNIAKQKNIDTGLGLERTLAVLNGFDDNYLTDLWVPLIKAIEDISEKRYGVEGETTKAIRIIADHIKAAVMILADDKKLVPSNLGRGYVLRRLIRRAVRYGKMIGIEGNFTVRIAEVVIEMYKDVYEEVGRNKEFVFNELNKEEEKFRKTLERGLKELKKVCKDLREKTEKAGLKHPHNKIQARRLSGIIAFDIYQSYGFPIEMILEEIGNYGVFAVDLEEFQEEFKKEFKKHQELSRTASAGMFKSGLADDSEAATRLHTATHLLQAALREVLGAHVEQRGSNITPERLRFDFSHPDKMAPEQIKQAEDWVNSIIEKNLPVIREEMTPEEAKASGALGLFDSKYGSKVSVYTIKEGDKIISREICAGPHVKYTGEIGKFKIQKEESSSQGIRRIKAVSLPATPNCR